MTKINEVAEALFLHDRDKQRKYDFWGYSKIMYGDPPCGFNELAESVKVEFRAQAAAAMRALGLQP